MTGLACHHEPVRAFTGATLDNVGLCRVQQLQEENYYFLGIDSFTEVMWIVSIACNTLTEKSLLSFASEVPKWRV